nr:EamA family transporter [Rhizobium herbae]
MVSLGLGPVKLATHQMLIAAVLLAPFAAPAHLVELARQPEALWALVLGLGLAGTGVAFVIYYQLIQILGALRAASVYYIPPVVALVVGWAFAGERENAFLL